MRSWDNSTSVNQPLTIKWANIAGDRGTHPPRRSTPAPLVVPASGLMTHFDDPSIFFASVPSGNGGRAWSRNWGQSAPGSKVRHQRHHRRPGRQVSGIKLPGFGDIGAFFKRGDLALAFVVLTILVVLILPLPPILLDLALATSIILSILILMTSLFIHAPLEFSSFPTVLLISTMLRLSLNLASTRLILSHGHNGTAAAGHVIEAFGNFVMGGNFVIGIIVFSILVIVNFVVITKGSGRIAEVAARFTLTRCPENKWRSTPTFRRDDRRERSAPPKEAARGRKLVLRRDGRRLEIRSRRRDRGPFDRIHQRRRRHRHRHGAAGHDLRRRRTPTRCSRSATALSRKSRR